MSPKMRDLLLELLALGYKPDMAQAGGKDASGLDKAIATAERLIGEKL